MKRPTPRVTAARLSELPTTYVETSDHNAYVAYMDAEITRLREALNGMIVALRIQARMAVRYGGEIALNEGNSDAWMAAKKALISTEEANR